MIRGGVQATARLTHDNHRDSMNSRIPPGQESLQRAALFRWGDSVGTDHAVCQKSLRSARGTDDVRFCQQLPGIAAHSDERRQRRHPGGSLFQHEGDRILPLQPPRVHPDRHARYSAPDRERPEQRKHHHQEQAGGRWRNLHPEPEFSDRVPFRHHQEHRRQVAGPDRHA